MGSFLNTYFSDELQALSVTTVPAHTGTPALPGGTDPTSPRHDRPKNPSWDGKYTTRMKIHRRMDNPGRTRRGCPLHRRAQGADTMRGRRMEHKGSRFTCAPGNQGSGFPWGGGLLGPVMPLFIRVLAARCVQFVKIN